MSRLTWFPFYVEDFRVATLELETDEIGVYFTMLVLCYARGGPLPGNAEDLKRILQRQIARFHGHSYNRIVPKLLGKYFYQDANGDWRQKRVEAELERARELTEKQRDRATKRWVSDTENEGKRSANVSQTYSKRSVNGLQNSEQPLKYKDNVDANNNTIQDILDTNVSNNIAQKPVASGLFDLFYDSYGKRKNRKAAEAKFIAAVRRGVDPDHIITAAKRYADAHARAGTDPQFIPAPDVWLNKGGYDDEDLPQPARAGPTVNSMSSRGGFASLWLKDNGFSDGQPSETRRADENVSEFPRLAVDERGDGGGDSGGLSGNLIELFAANSG